MMEVLEEVQRYADYLMAKCDELGKKRPIGLWDFLSKLARATGPEKQRMRKHPMYDKYYEYVCVN